MEGIAKHSLVELTETMQLLYSPQKEETDFMVVFFNVNSLSLTLRTSLARFMGYPNWTVLSRATSSNPMD